MIGENDAATRDRERLNDFLDEFEKLLSWTVQHSRRLLPRDIADDLVPAWSELNPSFRTVRARLAQVSFEELAERGLTGSQLNLKLNAFERERQKFDDKYRKTVEDGYPVFRFLRRVRGGTSQTSETTK
jgi:hypothetical protein